MRLPKADTVEIVPSVLAADFGRLDSEIAAVEAAGVKMIQFDIMDGRFVPNVSFGPSVVEAARRGSKLVFDVQLMTAEPRKHAHAFIQAGADHITFHIETASRPLEFVDELRDSGVTVGVALNPETSVVDVASVAPYCDLVLVMTVHPGFGGQSFLPHTLEKIRQVRDLVGPAVRLQVDGGISPETAPQAVARGADTLVAGSAVFGKKDRGAAIRTLRDAIGKNRSRRTIAGVRSRRSPHAGDTRAVAS
jgi:ribulose-phosphate 3-epimerase